MTSSDLASNSSSEDSKEMDAIEQDASAFTPFASESRGPVPLSVFQSLPKTDLHVHLDGSLRLKTILELADAQGIDFGVKDESSLYELIGCGRVAGSLVEYLRGFEITLQVMQTAESLERIAFELAEDAHRDNVRYMEVRYAPLLHTRRGLKLTAVVEAVLHGLGRARETFGILSNVILCGIRNISPESSYAMAELCVAYKNRGVVGFDLAGAEADFPPKHHRRAFQLVRDNNINTTIHAGEAYGPRSIAQAIHVCGAHRVGHGVRLREDGDLLHYVIDHRLPLECCPSSNVQTGAVDHLENHPIKLYFDLGVRVTVNTDNRLITDTTASKELWLCHTQIKMPFQDIKRLVVAGFKSSFRPFHERQAMLRKVALEIERFDDQGRLRTNAPPSDHPSLHIRSTRD